MKKTIRDIGFKGKRVLVRVDFNVPLDKGLNITDDTRITAALPTIEYIVKNGGRVILMSHLGRPKGKVKDEFRLTPVAKRLRELLGRSVKKTDDCIGAGALESAKALKDGDVLLLENLRFHPEEEANDPVFAAELASLGEVYVDDAFGACHREHASIDGVTKSLPSVAGMLLEKEMKYLGGVVDDPKKPFALIFGGAKVSDKVGIIENLLDKVDIILIGGGMAYTFLKSKGHTIGSSKLEAGLIDKAAEILDAAKSKGVKVYLPVDHVITKNLSNPSDNKVAGIDIEDGWMGVDIGPKSIEIFRGALKGARTIVWNGPLGVFEVPPFDKGSRAVAESLTALDATTIIGGGDTAAAISRFGLSDKMSHISTGGGASLEFLEGKILPGIAALNDK